MKEKIIIFIVGLLTGSIISTASIYIYTVAENKNNQDSQQTVEKNFGNRNGQTRTDGEMGNPPEMPNDIGQR